MSNTRIITRALAVVVGVLFIGSQAMAQAGPPSAMPGPQPSLTEFDAPGASNAFSTACNSAFLFAIGCGTTPLANNDLGEVVGTYNGCWASAARLSARPKRPHH